MSYNMRTGPGVLYNGDWAWWVSYNMRTGPGVLKHEDWAWCLIT